MVKSEKITTMLKAYNRPK